MQVEQGRLDSALRRYHEFVATLRRDYDRDPDEESQALHREIVEAMKGTTPPREVGPARADRPVLILVLEDDLVSSALIYGFLSEAGYEVVSVTDGADVLIEIGRRKYDLLILDVNVPTLDGLQVFEVMLQRRIDTPALFVSGIAGSETETQTLEKGAAGFLRKPIRREVLLQRVRAILQHAQQPVARQVEGEAC
jgi:CheY-like chemotaxis protein